MRLVDIANAAGGWIAPGSTDRKVSRAVIDSRKSCKDCLFFALSGSRTDGHAYVDDVIESGGIAVVSRGDRREGIVLVDDVEKALLDAAEWRRSTIGSRIIAITGSSGKTTTRLFLTAALESRFTVYSTSGNLNNHLGVPLTILNAPEKDADIIVLELGMNHAGELLHLGRIVSPADCLITNIGHAHMEFFDSMDDIARAKAELIRTTVSGGTCVMPAGEKILERTARAAGLKTRYFGDGSDAWFEQENGKYIVYPWKIEVKLQFRGSHNMMNAVSALLMSDTLGAQPRKAAGAIEKVTPVKGRGRVVKAGGLTIMDESYNANPESTLACLEVLEGVKGHRGAVLGDMRELGDDSPGYHVEILKRADNIGLDFIILTGDVYDSVKNTVTATDLYVAEDWKDALKILRNAAPSECTVLVKGSNSLKLSELVRFLEEGI